MDEQTTHSSSAFKTKQDEILTRIWRLKAYFIIPVFVSLLLGVFLVTTVMLRKGSETFTYKVNFNFSGVQEAQYPNGEPFRIEDVLAPNIIDAVYDKHIAGEFNISGQRFRDSFSISAYSPTHEMIVSKYKTLTSNRRITFAETTRAEQELEEKLRVASRGAAVISFQNSGLKLPVGVVSTSLENVLKEWNRYSIENRGVLNMNIRALEPAFLEVEALKSSGEITRLRSLIEMYRKVEEHLQAVSQYEISNALADTQTGETFTSLSSQLGVIQGLIIDLTRNWVLTPKESKPTLPGLLSASAFNTSAFEGLDFQIAYDLLLERIADIRMNIQIIKNADGSSISDPQSSMTISDLENVLNEIEAFQIRPIRNAVLLSGESKNPETVSAYYKQRIRELELKREQSLALAKVVSPTNKGANAFNGSSGNNSASRTQSSNIVSPQFDDGFLDRLIELSSKDKEINFQQELSRKSISLREEVARIEGQIAQLKSDLAIFEAAEASTQPSSQNSDATKNLERLLTQLKQHLGVTVRIGQFITAADQMKNVFTTEFSLEEDDIRLARQTYLRSDDLVSVTIEDIAKPLKGVVKTINRMSKQVDQELFGTKILASSFSRPAITAQPLINKRSMITMLWALMLGVLVGGFLTASRFFLGRD